MMKTIRFQIIFEENPQVYQSGYVDVPDEEDEFAEWFYYNQSGMEQPRMFTHHDGIGITQIGATDEQDAEVESFKALIFDNIDYITEVVETSSEVENRTYVKNGLRIIINEGAKFETNMFNYSSAKEWDSDYYLGFRLFYNGELIRLDDDIYFEDPYTYEDIRVLDILTLSHNMYVVEVPKDYFDEDWDSDYRKEVRNNYEDAFEMAFRRSLVHDLGVFGTAYSFIESKLGEKGDVKFFDGSYKTDYADATEDEFIDMDVAELYFMTSDDVEEIIRLDYEESQSLLEDAKREYELECEERERKLKEEFGF